MTGADFVRFVKDAQERRPMAALARTCPVCGQPLAPKSSRIGADGKVAYVRYFCDRDSCRWVDDGKGLRLAQVSEWI